MLNVERWMEQNLRKTYKGRFDSNSSPSSERQLCDKKKILMSATNACAKRRQFLIYRSVTAFDLCYEKKQLSKTKFAKFAKQHTYTLYQRLSISLAFLRSVGLEE